jgi:molybdate transport system ATP-binding protein
MRKGESWSIVGPNGSGKTTILHLITADNLQGYANDIRLFGRPRGSGESIWDIKQRMGIVTPHLQTSYLKTITAFEVVLSGFFDSVGLYRSSDPDQVAAAGSWMERLGLEELAERRFDRLSYGERRLILIARAMVKSPQLLVLDEPCQGLDPAYRTAVLELIDHAGEYADILFVTHHQSEVPDCVSHRLELVPSPAGSRGVILQ